MFGMMQQLADCSRGAQISKCIPDVTNTEVHTKRKLSWSSSPFWNTPEIHSIQTSSDVRQQSSIFVAGRYKFPIQAELQDTFFVIFFSSSRRLLCFDFIHSTVICLTTGPQPLPKRFLHLMRYRASSFK